MGKGVQANARQVHKKADFYRRPSASISCCGAPSGHQHEASQQGEQEGQKIQVDLSSRPSFGKAGAQDFHAYALQALGRRVSFPSGVACVLHSERFCRGKPEGYKELWKLDQLSQDEEGE